MTRYDPLGYDQPLPLEETFYPFGFPLALRTNSAAVLRAARQLWGRYTADFPGAAMQFRIFVAGTGMPHSPVLPRGSGNVIVSTHDRDNYAVCDLGCETTSAWITGDLAENPGYLAEHFLELFCCFMVSAKRAVIIHAACVGRNGKGILLCGDSGAGKTSVAWGCARRGWEFLSGDATQLVRDSKDTVVTGRPCFIRFREASRALFPELLGYPAVVGPRGKLDIEADPVALGAVTAQTMIASHIILLERSETSPAALLPVSAEEVFAYLNQAVFYGPEELREKHRERLRDFLRLPLLRLRYSNPDEAEQALRELVGDPAPC